MSKSAKKRNNEEHDLLNALRVLGFVFFFGFRVSDFLMHETARLLRDLVRLPSVNPMGRSLPEELAFEQRVTDYLQQAFRTAGLVFERREVAPLHDNIIAHYPGSPSKSGILLEVHQDTVPADHMTIAPFEGASKTVASTAEAPATSRAAWPPCCM